MLVVQWNHYTCPDCGGITITQEMDDGVTPFMLRCRVHDRLVDGAQIPGCYGLAESGFYRGSQDPTQQPHVIFYRPANPADAIEAINKEPKRVRRAMLEHYQKGGSLLKEVPRG